MPLQIPNDLLELKDKIPFFKKKKKAETPEEALSAAKKQLKMGEPPKEESIPSDLKTEANDGMMTAPDLEQDKQGPRLKQKAILGVLAALGIFVVGTATFKIMSPPEPIQQDKQLPELSVSNPNKTPAADLPDKYSDISKYQAKKNATNSNKVNPNQPAPVNPNLNARAQGSTGVRPAAQAPRSSSPGSSYQASSPAPQSHPSSFASQISKEEQKQREETQKAIESAIAFALGGGPTASTASNNSESSTGPTPVSLSSDDGSPMETYSGSYELRAGSIIQATLLTGVTTDQPGGDVVAQVRQNVYDSQTGEHLLIPQGAKLIGKYGGGGERGNGRVAIGFSRIILPTGVSIDLPDQKAIDGIGYPGLKDQYTEHRGKLWGATFMSALIAAAAQSATGNTGGSDTRSPGQEAVSGAVADVLDSVKTIVDQQAQVKPTAEIRPGFEFSIFINKDLSIPEYVDSY